MLRRRIFAAVMVFVFAALLSGRGWAAEKVWTGAAGDTLWSTAGNWSPAGTPVAADNVTFTNLGFTDASFVLGGAANNVVDAAFANSVNALGYRNITGFHNTTLV